MNTDTRTRPRIVIVYESMFGNTRHIAEAIAEGIRSITPSTLLPIAHVHELPAEVDLLVIGGPTHTHSMSRPESREEAINWVTNERLHLELDDAWHETGIREWLRNDPPNPRHFAAFDTRVDMPRLFTGSAAVAIARKLGKRGVDRLGEPESFLVDHKSQLESGETERARAWGAELAAQLVPPPRATDRMGS